MTTMTVTSIMGDVLDVLSNFTTYLAIGVAIPLGFKAGGIVKRWVTKR